MGKMGYGDVPQVRLPFFTIMIPGSQKHKIRKISPSGEGVFFEKFWKKVGNFQNFPGETNFGISGSVFHKF